MRVWVESALIAQTSGGKGIVTKRVKLWRNGRQKLVGTVELDEHNRRLAFHIDDDEERERVTGVFNDTGEVSWAWSRYGDGDWLEHRAEPRTRDWFWFVVANILYPLGYQADSE